MHWYQGPGDYPRSLAWREARGKQSIVDLSGYREAVEELVLWPEDDGRTKDRGSRETLAHPLAQAYGYGEISRIELGRHKRPRHHRHLEYLHSGHRHLCGIVGSCESGQIPKRHRHRHVRAAFIARQNPLAIVPVAVLLGGISASGGMLQRRLDLPDATVLVLQGLIFLVLLASETLYGRFAFFRDDKGSDRK